MADTKIFRFPNEIDTVELSSASAKLIVVQSDDDVITVEYNNPRETPELQAMIVNTSLIVKEKTGFKIFGSWIPGDYQLKVSLPKTIYKSIKIGTAAGGADVDGFEAETLEVNSASGNLNICAYANKIKVHSVSGNINLTNFNDQKYCSYLETNAVSGNISVNNYTCGEYAIHSVSGSTICNDISGQGRISVTSGIVTINCCDWTDDIDISAISGTITLYLPDESAANISFKGASGNVRTDLLSKTAGHCVSIAKGTSGPYGGGIMHNVNVSLTSGTVSILKSGKPSKHNQPDAVYVPEQEPKEGVCFEEKTAEKSKNPDVFNTATNVVNNVATVIVDVVETAVDAVQSSMAKSNSTNSSQAGAAAPTSEPKQPDSTGGSSFSSDGTFSGSTEEKAPIDIEKKNGDE